MDEEIIVETAQKTSISNPRECLKSILQDECVLKRHDNMMNQMKGEKNNVTF